MPSEQLLAEMGKFFPKTVANGPCKEVIQRDNFNLLPGFQVERLYTVPKSELGSWVSITFDPTFREMPVTVDLRNASLDDALNALAAALDVRDGAAMSAYAEQFVRQAQGIDLVIANAGISAGTDRKSVV